MTRKVRTRFWIELAMASVTGCLALITLLWQDWIEIVVGRDPDQGNGSVEWLIFAAFAVATTVLAAAARLEWRRSPAMA